MFASDSDLDQRKELIARPGTDGFLGWTIECFEFCKYNSNNKALLI